MSRLSEVQSLDLENLVLGLQASLDELKSTPQLTSNMSGVKTYQNPATDAWQPVDLTDKNGNVTYGVLSVPVSWVANGNGTALIECEFIPTHQASPIVYPFLEVSVDGVTWKTTLHLDSLAFEYDGESTNNRISSYMNLLNDNTDYSQTPIHYKYSIYAYVYAKNNGAGSATLQFRFRTRSSDKGETKVKVRLY